MSEENFIDNAEVILAIRGYETVDIRKKKSLVDYTVSSQRSDDKILVRVIIETPSKTGFVGVDSVKEMNDFLEKRNYDKGVLVGKRFTEAAKNEMKMGNIEMISDTRKPYFTSMKLFSVINDYTQKLCQAKCGQIPLEDSKCRGHPDGHYICDIRLTSDNADFHFERRWTSFLEKDLMKLLAIEKSTN